MQVPLCKHPIKDSLVTIKTLCINKLKLIKILNSINYFGLDFFKNKFDIIMGRVPMCRDGWGPWDVNSSIQFRFWLYFFVFL